jgi:CBS-domain-containing membrane protein
VKEKPNQLSDEVNISDADVMKAMAAIPGYIDITTRDFKAVYRIAHDLARERILRSVRAKDIMARPVHVVKADTPLVHTATLLAEKDISGVPVVDGESRVLGVVSEKDLLMRMGSLGASFMEIIANCLNNKGCLAAPVRAKTAGDIMTHPAITAREDMTVADIAALFGSKKINRVPIVDEDGKLKGIVARSDLVNAYCRMG